MFGYGLYNISPLSTGFFMFKGPYIDSVKQLYLINAASGNNFVQAQMSCERAPNELAVTSWSLMATQVVATFNTIIRFFDHAYDPINEKIYIVTTIADSGSFVSLGIYNFVISTLSFNALEISGVLVADNRPWDGTEFIPPSPLSGKTIRVLYLASNKLFIIFSNSFSDGVNINRGIYYAIYNITSGTYDTPATNLASPALAGSLVTSIGEACLDPVNERILFIYNEASKDLETGGVTWNYKILDYAGTSLFDGVIGTNISFHFNGPGETLYLKTFPTTPFYSPIGVFGNCVVGVESGTRKFFCPFKGTKARLHLAKINVLTGALEQEVIDATDYCVRMDGNTANPDFITPNLGFFKPTGENLAVFYEHLPSGNKVRINRKGESGWNTAENVLAALSGVEGSLNINTYGENEDSFFGVRQLRNWGPLTSITIVPLSVSVGDTLIFGDFAQAVLGFVDQPPPPTPVEVCPDIVASSACAEVKTISDDEPILTNCDETVFSESAAICPP